MAMNEAPHLRLDEPPAIKFYMALDGQRKGPFTMEELPEHGLEHDTLVWHTGLSEWLRADKVPALREVLLTIPPPLPEMPPPVPARAPRDPAEGFRTLHVWWLILLGGTVGLPLMGGLAVAWAQVEYRPQQQGLWVVYEYTSLGRALLGLGVVLMVAASVSLVAAVVVFCVLLYKTWSLIQDGHARTTPDRAVGFLFIPFFNLYWIFVAVRGLAIDLGAYLRRHGRDDTAAPSPGLALAFCILFVFTCVPYLGVVTVIPMLVLLVLMVISLKSAAVAIVSGRRPVAPARPLPDPPDAITGRRPSPEAL
jgi:hypothetical protein